MMHESQFQKSDPYDWFCAPGSHIWTHFNRLPVIVCLFGSCRFRSVSAVCSVRISRSSSGFHVRPVNALLQPVVALSAALLSPGPHDARSAGPRVPLTHVSARRPGALVSVRSSHTGSRWGLSCSRSRVSSGRPGAPAARRFSGAGVPAPPTGTCRRLEEPLNTAVSRVYLYWSAVWFPGYFPWLMCHTEEEGDRERYVCVFVCVCVCVCVCLRGTAAIQTQLF